MSALSRVSIGQRLLSVLTLFFLLFSGCASHRGEMPASGQGAMSESLTSPGTAGDYLLQSGDTLDIKFFFYPELNETVKIRPDGMISLQLIGEVKAEGLAAAALDTALTERYGKVLSNPDVAVIVKDFAGQKIYVGGEVNAPGLVPLAGRLTSLQAIIQAGGLRNTAEMKNVVIIRNQGTDRPHVFIVNLKQELSADAPTNDVLLRAYDIVFVPKTTIAEINQFVDQYINKLIPGMASLNVFYNLNPDVRVK